MTSLCFLLYIYSLILDAVSVNNVPFWNTTIPDLNINKSAGIRTINEKHFTIYNSTSHDGSKNPNGTYNHGPIITYFNNLFYVSWYNSPQNESQYQHVLLSISIDSISWSKPIEIFTNITYIGTNNEPFTIINDRLYTSADVQPGNNTFIPVLMRQIYKNNTFGDIFWLNNTVPNGFEYLGYKTYLNMNNNTIFDMKIYFASLIATNNVNESNITVTSTERSLYLIPSTINLYKKQLILLMRTSPEYQHEFYSTCFIEQNNSNIIVSNNNLFSCRPQGGTPNLIDIVNEYKNNPSECNWSHAMETNIPDATSRTCTSTLHDGRIYLLGNQLSKNNTANKQPRDVLMLTISNDGFNFNQTWAIRYNPPPIKYYGYSKNPGFAYPGGMWNIEKNNLYVTYSVNKEDIQVSVISLDAVKKKQF